MAGQGGEGDTPGNQGDGGGIYWSSDDSDSGSANLTHTTVSANHAAEGGGIKLLSVGRRHTVHLTHSVVAQNLAADSPDLHIAVLSHGFLDYDEANFVGVAPTCQNISDSPSATGNALLLPLSDYGGPTFTMLPAPGSPLVDASTGSSALHDQRNQLRQGTPDLGAAEFTGVPALSGFPDTDNDGMDDTLEPQYGFVVGDPDGEEDADGDGSTNAAELKNMTGPRDNTSLLKIVDFERLSNSVFLEWTSVPGLEYEILFGDSGFTFPGSAVVLSPADDFTHSANVLFPSSVAEQYFRVKRR